MYIPQTVLLNLQKANEHTFQVANLSVEHREGRATGHTLCHCLVINPCSHGNLLLFQFICMLPEGYLLSVRMCSLSVCVQCECEGV